MKNTVQSIKRRMVHSLLNVASTEWVMKCVVGLTSVQAKLRAKKKGQTPRK